MRGKISGLLLVLSVSLSANAEPEFPGAIQEAAQIPCTPTCLLCHTAIPGTLQNLKQPFGLTVFSHGAVPGHPESMHTVVARLRDEKVDTDQDGKLDVDELAVGSNPSDPDPRKEICGPAYGCGAHVAAAPPASVSRAPALYWLVAALALSAFVAVRRRRC